MTKLDRDLLGLAGEYRVCSELNKRGIFATVTYGNRKSVDVYAISDRRERVLKIEVKTSQRAGFVTRITQKNLENDANSPDFWVLFQLHQKADGDFVERFFVLSHAEICRVQRDRNRKYGQKYRRTHGMDADFSTGVDNVRVVDVERFQDGWERIAASLEGHRRKTDTAGTGKITAAEVRKALEARLREAATAGKRAVRIRAGDIHGALGAVARMPTVCQAMRKAMAKSDEVVAAPPKGIGASLTIEYQLPRP